MADLIDVVDLRATIKKHGLTDVNNFEEAYALLSQNHPDTARELEEKVGEYFKRLRLPNRPTLYDYLVLFLREKDVIATFNWDPLLFQAISRNQPFLESCGVDLPSTYFLHGNVAVSYCPEHKLKGSANEKCPTCGSKFLETKLLYPILQKDYSRDKFINMQWDCVRYFLNKAYLFTAFGYGAPASDVEAVSLLKTAWTTNTDSKILETEIVDILAASPEGKEQLRKKWAPFLFSQHYQLYSELSSSYIFRFPRRSCEEIYKPTVAGKFPSQDAQIPHVTSLQEIHDWLEPLIKDELGRDDHGF